MAPFESQAAPSYDNMMETQGRNLKEESLIQSDLHFQTVKKEKKTNNRQHQDSEISNDTLKHATVYRRDPTDVNRGAT